jgi:hypothetical protein
LEILRGLPTKTRDDGLISRKPGFLTSLPCEGVLDDLDRAITNQRRVLTSGPGMSATGEGEQADQPGLAPRGVGTDRRGPGVERADATDIHRSEPLIGDRRLRWGARGFIAR